MTIRIDGTNTAANPGITGADADTGLQFGTDEIKVVTGGTEAITVDASQRVGVGTTTPDQKFDLSAGANLNLGIDQIAHNSFTNEGIGLTLSSSGSDTDLMAVGVVDTDKLGIFSREGIVFGVGGATTYSATSETMRVDDAGRLLVGTSSNITSATTQVKDTVGQNVISCIKSSTGGMINFVVNNTTEVGYISTTASSTSYVTSSDYRLKENVVPITDGITRLQKLKPNRFNFIVDADTTVDGFIAHEVQEVIPEAATGTKDEVDADGNPVYQGIDQSKLVPLLTAALQEAITRIETLEAEVQALKGGN